MRLIDSLYLPEHQSKILQSMQDTNMILEQILSSLQQLDQIREYIYKRAIYF